MRPAVSREPNHVTLIRTPMPIDGLALSSITDQWFDIDYWEEKGSITGSADGRGTTHFIHHQGFDFVLRRYRRGGLIRHVSRDKFVFTGIQNTRPWQELTLHSYMLSKELPVPTAVAGKVTRIGPWYTADLLSLRIPHAQDLHQCLLANVVNEKQWHKTGEVIAQLHNAQVYHHDLNIHNIMMDADNKIWIIDFDKCGIRQGDKWKAQNLARLQRSLNKELGKYPHYHFRPQDWQALLLGYQNTVT